MGALVRGLKYRGHTFVVPYLVSRLTRLPVVHHEQPLVVPMPLHPRRLAERGFNQADLLARGVARSLQLEYEPRVLRRKKPTRPLAGLSRDERQAEVQQAFQVARPQRTRRRGVLLVDDVLTTGASANACARALLCGGARYVDVMVVARAES